ncbi:MAG TPA: hypothetical protein VIH42_05050, partial [Thermoguttaceae bacterium]
MRKTYLKPIPTVVWVVEYLCDDCRCSENLSAGLQGTNPPADCIRELSKREFQRLSAEADATNIRALPAGT